MKTAFSVMFAALLFVAGCGKKSKEIDGTIVSNSKTASGEVNEGELAEITWDELEYDFGEVIEGQKVTHKYTFTNTGDHPLLITYAKASCGCTEPEYPKEAIAPGEKGEIFVTFNSQDRVGPADKSVTIQANTEPNTHTLKLTGNVIEADE